MVAVIVVVVVMVVVVVVVAVVVVVVAVVVIVVVVTCNVKRFIGGLGIHVLILVVVAIHCSTCYHCNHLLLQSLHRPADD